MDDLLDRSGQGTGDRGLGYGEGRTRSGAGNGFGHGISTGEPETTVQTPSGGGDGDGNGSGCGYGLSLAPMYGLGRLNEPLTACRSGDFFVHYSRVLRCLGGNAEWVFTGRYPNLMLPRYTYVYPLWKYPAKLAEMLLTGEM